MTDYNNTKISGEKGIWALSPLIVFLCLYLLVSLIAKDFYKVPLTVAFLVSSAYAILITRNLSLNERIQQYSKGASNPNIMLMIWIFVLAGAFAESAKTMGAVDATVNLTLQLLPGKLLYAGIFITSCFISLSIGTSVGTIVALVPIAAGLAAKTGSSIEFMTAIVVGGAFFGDNLSFISDTTIAATRTQGCAMRDKFLANIHIALPAAVIILAFYILKGMNTEMVLDTQNIEWIKIVPYIVVLGTAVIGLNVMIVLIIGIILVGIIGIYTGSYNDIFNWFGSMGNGIIGMGELIIITMMAGGMLEIIRYNGGIDYIIQKLTANIKGKRGGEFCIAALVCIANICTANNTVAIITVGSLANDIANKFEINKHKSASILDTFSCVIQGLIPYGAQILMAANLALVAPLDIVFYLYYPMILCICALLSILLRFPKKYS